MRASRWLVRLLPLACLALAPLSAIADDPPAPAPAPPSAPVKDDLSEIQPEFKKKIKPKGDAQLAKDRAAYYETKGFRGSGLFYLGCIYEVAGDPTKTIETLEKFLQSGQGLDGNKESAMMRIMAAHVKLQAYDKAIAMGETVLKAYPMSGHAAQNMNEMGRTYRRWGKDDEALKKFLASADGKFSQGVFDAIDLYLVKGDVAQAKETLKKYAETLKASTKGAVEEMREFLDAVGTPAPALEGARSPTKTEVPATFSGSWTVIYVGSLTLSNMERRLTVFSSVKRAWDKTEPWFVIRYDQWDPFQKKVVKELTPDQEFELQAKVMEKESGGAQVLTVSRELWDKLHLKTFGQRMIIDPEGKFRWMRLTEQRGNYDALTFEKALDAFAGKGTGGSSAAPEAGDGGDAPGGGGDAPGGGVPDLPGGDK